MSDYVPRPGSKTERALIALQRGPLSAAAISDVMDCDTKQVDSILKTAIEHGAIEIDRGTTPRTFRLPPTSPPAAEAPGLTTGESPAIAPVESKRREFIAACGAERKEGESVFDYGWRCFDQGLSARQSRDEIPVFTKVAASQAATATAPSPTLDPHAMRFGLFSDGQLVIEHDGQTLTLDAANSDRLVRFLDSTARFPL